MYLYFYTVDFYNKKPKFILSDDPDDHDSNLIAYEYGDSDNDYSDKETGFRNDFGKPPYRRHNDRSFIATLYGVSKTGETIAIHITNYLTKLYIKIRGKDKIDPNNFARKIIKFTNYCIENNPLRPRGRTITKHTKQHVTYSIIDKIDGHKGFRNGKLNKFICLQFRNSNTRMTWYKYLKKISYDDQGNLMWDHQQHDDNIRPIKVDYAYYNNYKYGWFYYFCKIKPTGWHTISDFKYVTDGKITRCNQEIVVDFNTINIAYNPDDVTMPNFMQMSFDIETYPKETSRIYRGKTACILQKKGLSNAEIYKQIKSIYPHSELKNDDPITTIGISLEKGTRVWNYVLTLKYKGDKNNYKDPIQGHKTECDQDIEDFIILPYLTEKRLLLDFCKIVRKYRPNFIFQYNGNNYDWNYIYERCEYYDITRNLMASSMLLGKSRWYSNVYDTAQSGLVVNKFPKLHGMVNVDVYKYYKKLNEKGVKSLKLGDVLLRKCKIRKVKLDYRDMYRKIDYAIYEKNTSTKDRRRHLIDVCAYCLRDCTSLRSLSKVSAIVPYYLSQSLTALIPIFIAINNGQSKLSLGRLSVTAWDKRNCMWGDGRTTDAAIKKKLWDDVIEVDTDLQDKYNAVKYTTTGKVCKNYEQRQKTFIREYIKGFRPMGAFVYKQIRGLREFISLLDFAHLYPAIMINDNDSPENIVRNPKYLGIPGVEYTTFKWLRQNGKGEEFTVATNKKDRSRNKGAIPIMLEIFLKSRADIRKKMKIIYQKLEFKFIHEGIPNEKIRELISADPEYSILHCQQLAIKVCCNSIYGLYGSKYSIVYFPEICGAVTYQGKHLISKVCPEFLKKHYDADVVYGDTDSILVQFNEEPKRVDDELPEEEVEGEDKSEDDELPYAKNSEEYKRKKFEKVWDLSIDFSKNINTYFKEQLSAPMLDLGLEKVFRKLWLTGVKKKYVGIMCESRDYDKTKKKIMGRDFIKRDSSPFETTVGEKITEIILSSDNDKIASAALISFLRKLIHDMYAGVIPIKEYVKMCTYKDTYKRPEIMCSVKLHKFFMNVDEGSAPLPGDKIGYIYIQKGYTIGSGGGLTEPKKVELVYPFELYDATKNTINYVQYIRAIMSHSYDIFEHYIGLNYNQFFTKLIFEQAVKYNNIDDVVYALYSGKLDPIYVCPYYKEMRISCKAIAEIIEYYPITYIQKAIRDRDTALVRAYAGCILTDRVRTLICHYASKKNFKM